MDTFAPLREREFRLLFAGRIVSLAGNAFAPIALAFAVLELDGSATDLGVVLAAGTIPQLVFFLVGGVWADRLPRNLVVVGTNVVNAAVQLTAAALLLTGVAELWHLVALSVARGIAMAFFFPASQGLVPQAVSPELLQQANALLQVSMSLTNVLGAALGGILVAATSPGTALAFDGVTYLASAVILAGMRLPRRARTAASTFLAELREGWREFRSRRWLWLVVSQHAVFNAFVSGSFFILGPVIAHESLGGARDWGFILAAHALGVLAGGLVAVRYRPQRPLVWSAAVFLPFSLVLVLLGSLQPLGVLAPAVAVSGIGFSLGSVLWETTVQQRVPPEKLSRVVSYDALGSYAAIPVGYALVGPVSEGIGVEATCFVSAAILVSSIALQLSVREVRELRAPEPVSPKLGIEAA
ncbi:MAG TPA: MFS transporter [Gaiellaceae bacterium]